ncbi:catalase [Claviceps purpurea]|nr:catalase [Claviceps purpurea]
MPLRRVSDYQMEAFPKELLYDTFTSYGDYSNITAASFLGQRDKKTPVSVRFSTGASSRDMHEFGVRL